MDDQTGVTQEPEEAPRVPAPPRADPIAGRLFTESFDYDGGRQVTAYVPPDPPQAIVYAGDGGLISGWGASLEAAALPPTLTATMIVGVHHTDDPDEMARIREYSPSFAPEVFATHEAFFVNEVRDWVRHDLRVELSRDRTAVCGVSASAELALALGVRHPDVYGAVFAASPGGGYQPPEQAEQLPTDLPRTYLVAGTLEPWFAENARRWANTLTAAGADVTMVERVGDHGDPFWEAEFPQMLTWAFGR